MKYFYVIGIAAVGLAFECAAADVPQSGKEAYLRGCASCHATGVNGAPKVGEHAQWGMLIGMGRRTLYKYTIEGRGSMPARGGTLWPDATIRAAVDYMVGLNK
jgi:cytochrome c5